MHRKILQIMPAQGWRAIYRNEVTGCSSDIELPVACFALIEEAVDGDMGHRIVPMIATGEICDDAEADNYEGCVGPGFSKDSVKHYCVEYTRNNNSVLKIIRQKE